MSGPRRQPSIQSQSSLPRIDEKMLKSGWSEDSFAPAMSPTRKVSRGSSNYSAPVSSPTISVSHADQLKTLPSTSTSPPRKSAEDFVLVEDTEVNYSASDAVFHNAANRSDKASRLLGIKHRASMEPIPASTRTSVASARSVPSMSAAAASTSPLTSLYVVSGLPKSPHTWTLSDPDAVMGLNHSENAVNRWWRPEVLGSTVSPGVGGTLPSRKRNKRNGKEDAGIKGAGALTKSEVGKMLSKTLKLSFTREVEIIASTLQPPSTIHTFTFTLPAPSTVLPSDMRSSMLTADNSINPSSAFALGMDPFARPSSTYLGPQSLLGHSTTAPPPATGSIERPSDGNTVTYYGCVLTVFSHADGERSAAIRRTLESSSPRMRKESHNRLRQLKPGDNVAVQAKRSARRNARGPWGANGGATTDADTDAETEADGALSESDFEVASTVNPGESTLFLPGDTVFWLPYALTLVSRHPVYDLMRDYLTLSWARFSKDVQSHTLQISKILAHPAPRAGDLVRLDASPSPNPAPTRTNSHARSDSIGSSTGDHSNLEVIARFPGGLDFGRGLVDVNFTMWPLFKCLNVDNILTACEIALSPTGRVLFFSRHPTMLGIAVSTLKYLVELRGWSGIALPAVHARDAKIYVDDPGPWIIGLATEARYAIKVPADVCIIDLDINYLNCQAPPPGAISTKQQREKYRQKLLAAFDSIHYHPDHSVPSEFKEAFPAGRFRPICKIQAKRGASSAAVADQIKPPDWWNSTKIIQAFDAVLTDKAKKPSFFKRISSFGSPRRPPHLTPAEQHIQMSIRKRATAFVDARDDLETKIGRLSRRLNFLMTESDLWRDKFVSFEQYAEKLSAEASQLRSKINKEQKETKRLSGLYTLTAAEKQRLEQQLQEKEDAHLAAMKELEHMREAMERMEEERAEMVAEVEAQIERALASMAVDMDSDYSYSRPSSRLSNLSSSMRSRRGSEASRSRQLKSRGTESTLAEAYDDHGDETLDTGLQPDRKTGTINEEEENDSLPDPTRKKRFSATETDPRQDGMSAVDEGITHKSDKIAQKVMEIQQKLETALANEKKHKRGRKSKSSLAESGEESSGSAFARRRATPKLTSPPPKARARSGTTSSNLTSESTPIAASFDRTMSPTPQPAPVFIKPAEPDESSSSGADERSNTPEPKSVRKIASGASLSALKVSKEVTDSLASPQLTPTTPGLTPTISGQTDDSDTEFQSAYSDDSPRNSYIGQYDKDDVNSNSLKPGFTHSRRPISAFRMGRSTSPSLSDQTVDAHTRV